VKDLHSADMMRDVLEATGLTWSEWAGGTVAVGPAAFVGHTAADPVWTSSCSAFVLGPYPYLHRDVGESRIQKRLSNLKRRYESIVVFRA